MAYELTQLFIFSTSLIGVYLIIRLAEQHSEDQATRLTFLAEKSQGGRCEVTSIHVHNNSSE